MKKWLILVAVTGCSADVLTLAASHDSGADGDVSADASGGPDTSTVRDAGPVTDSTPGKDSSFVCQLTNYSGVSTPPQFCHVEDVPECNALCSDGDGGAYQYGVACQGDTFPHGPAAFRKAYEPDGGKQWVRYCGNGDYCQPNWKTPQCATVGDGGFPYEWTCASKRIPGPMMPDGCKVNVDCTSMAQMGGDTFCSSQAP